MSADPILGKYLEGKPNSGIYDTSNLAMYTYVGANPLIYIDPDGNAKVGDVVFFNWSTSTRSTGGFPRHAAVVTQVDSSGLPAQAFGAWGMNLNQGEVGKYQEADLTSYPVGASGKVAQDFIIGTGDMSGHTSQTLDEFKAEWEGVGVTDWSGAGNSLVCIDAVTSVPGVGKKSLEGYGGQTLRDAMKKDIASNPSSYKSLALGGGKSRSPDPKNQFGPTSFFRNNSWLKQFFDNTGRLTDLEGRRQEKMKE